jgi:hypothetical protein
MKVGSIPLMAPRVELTPAIFAAVRSSDYGEILRAIVIFPFLFFSSRAS